MCRPSAGKAVQHDRIGEGRLAQASSNVLSHSNVGRYGRSELRPIESGTEAGRNLGYLRTLIAAAALAFGIGAGAWLNNQHHSWRFAFTDYENDGIDVRLEDAKSALNKLLPIGSSLTLYDRFFQDQGGGCSKVDDVIRFPNTMICSYAHGVIVSAEWKYVVSYDPATLRSKQVTLTFGLTGP